MSTLEQKLGPVEDSRYQGLAQRFQQTFGVVLTFTTSTDKKAARAKMLGKDTGYPMAFAAFKTRSIDETRYSPKALLLRGVTSGATSDSMLTYKAELLPVVETFEITFLTQDEKELRSFSKEWLFSALRGSLKFTIQWGVADIDISLELDREVTIPEKKGGLTDVNEYELTTNLKISGYLSPDHLDKVQAVTEVNVDGYSGSQADYEALTAAAARNGQMFEFKKQWSTTVGIEGSRGDLKTVGP